MRIAALENLPGAVAGHAVPTKTHILNLLHRLIDPKQTDHPKIDPPDALTLETAPKANVDRYDDLRQAREKRNAS